MSEPALKVVPSSTVGEKIASFLEKRDDAAKTFERLRDTLEELRIAVDCEKIDTIGDLIDDLFEIAGIKP